MVNYRRGTKFKAWLLEVAEEGDQRPCFKMIGWVSRMVGWVWWACFCPHVPTAVASACSDGVHIRPSSSGGGSGAAHRDSGGGIACSRTEGGTGYGSAAERAGSSCAKEIGQGLHLTPSSARAHTWQAQATHRGPPRGPSCCGGCGRRCASR